MSDYALVLLSGGVDSAASLSFYLNAGFTATGLFIDFGQLAAKREHLAATAIASHYNIPLRRLKLSGLPATSHGFIPGRNALLLSAAMVTFPLDNGTIVIGIHSGIGYSDCTTG